MYTAMETKVTAPPMLSSDSRPPPLTIDPQAPVHLEECKVLFHLNSEEAEEVVGPCAGCSTLARQTT